MRLAKLFQEAGVFGAFGECEHREFVPLTKEYYELVQWYLNEKSEGMVGLSPVSERWEHSQRALYERAKILGYEQLFHRLSLQSYECVRVPFEHWIYVYCEKYEGRMKAQMIGRMRECRETGGEVGGGSAEEIMKGGLKKAEKERKEGD